MKKIACVLSGCGYLDGAEIQEAVITMLALLRRGVEVQWFAPDRDQHHVMNHLSAEAAPGERNLLVESARIVRGEIKTLSELAIEDFDGLVMPGGFGVAKNLCSFAFEGAGMQVLPEVEDLVISGHRQHKALGFICIAPVIPAFVLGRAGRYPLVTIGNHPGTIQAIESWGASHELSTAEQICVDLGNKLVTTAAWNCAENPVQVETGINKLVERLLEMI